MNEEYRRLAELIVSLLNNGGIMHTVYLLPIITMYPYERKWLDSIEKNL